MEIWSPKLSAVQTLQKTGIFFQRTSYLWNKEKKNVKIYLVPLIYEVYPKCLVKCRVQFWLAAGFGTPKHLNNLGKFQI